MTDMHIYHPWMGIVAHEKYYEYIDNVINKNKIEKIYIASDNFESIHLMKERYGDLIINYDTIYRSESCDSNPHNLRLHKWNVNKSFFVDSFIDSLLLSNCDILIGRNSLYSWGSHIFSKDCQKYYNIK